MAVFETFDFLSSDKVHRIQVLKSVPEGEIRGVIQIAHGIAEHIGRYREFMSFLADAGFVCVGDDHLGHGKTITSPEDTGAFCEKRGWRCAVKDLETLHDLTVRSYPGVPYVLFGHSMGSFLMRTYMIDYPDKYDAAILSGTGHQGKLLVAFGNLAAELVVRKKGYLSDGSFLNTLAMGSYLKKIKNPATEFDWISRDADQVARYVEDPLCGFTAKSGLYADLLKGVRYVTEPKNIRRMNKEKTVYFMSGEQDPVGDYGKGVRRAVKAFKKAGMKYVGCRLYPEGRHEMLNEVNRAQVYAEILSWLNETV